MKDSDWTAVKKFVQSVLDAYTVDANKTHAGLISYSGFATRESKLDDSFDSHEIVENMNNIAQAQDETDSRLDRVMDLARYEVSDTLVMT